MHQQPPAADSSSRRRCSVDFAGGSVAAIVDITGHRRIGLETCQTYRRATAAWWVALCVAALAAVACGPVSKSAFTPTNYHTDYGYDVVFQQGTTDVLPPIWRLDNFYRTRNGLSRKLEGRYVTTYKLDNESGARSRSFEAYTYELRYEHTVSSAEIWLSSIPISPTLGQKDLRILMQGYITDLTQPKYEVVQPASAHTAAVVVGQPLTATLLEEGVATIAGQPAYVATVDITDAQHPTSGGAGRRMRLVLLRAPGYEKGQVVGSTHRYPVVVVAGYSNMPTDFDASAADFQDFLQRLTINGVAGVKIDLPSAPPAVPLTSL
jgi:hypothetical protein